MSQLSQSTCQYVLGEQTLHGRVVRRLCNQPLPCLYHAAVPLTVEQNVIYNLHPRHRPCEFVKDPAYLVALASGLLTLQTLPLFSKNAVRPFDPKFDNICTLEEEILSRIEDADPSSITDIRTALQTLTPFALSDIMNPELAHFLMGKHNPPFAAVYQRGEGAAYLKRLITLCQEMLQLVIKGERLGSSVVSVDMQRLATVTAAIKAMAARMNTDPKFRESQERKVFLQQALPKYNDLMTDEMQEIDPELFAFMQTYIPLSNSNGRRSGKQGAVDDDSDSSSSEEEQYPSRNKNTRAKKRVVKRPSLKKKL